MPHYMLLEALWQYYHAWIAYRSICRVILAMKDHVTQGTISHVILGCTRQMDWHDKHMSNQNTCNEFMSSANLCTIHSNDQSGKYTSNTNMCDTTPTYQTI